MCISYDSQRKIAGDERTAAGKTKRIGGTSDDREINSTINPP
jgi:hypothetical protein